MNRDELRGWARPLPRVALILLALFMLPFQLVWHLWYEAFKYLAGYLAELAELWELE